MSRGDAPGRGRGESGPGRGSGSGGRRSPARRGSEPGKGREGGPTPVGQALGEFLRKHGLEGEVEGQAALARWEEVVGERIAGVARPTGVSRGVLFVEVASSAWLAELTLMRHDILRRLNGGEGGKVDRIVFRLAEERRSGSEG